MSNNTHGKKGKRIVREVKRLMTVLVVVMGLLTGAKMLEAGNGIHVYLLATIPSMIVLIALNDNYFE